jgi:ATP-dependent RNA helicase RhlE
VSGGLKAKLMMAILEQTDTKSVLIFTRTKQRAKRLAEQIDRAGYKVTSLHGNRSQGQRQDALSGFKDGEYQIMVATDIAARGLDVESISHVINYDMPDTPDAYIHRIGRTGRAERTGDAFTIVCPEDSSMVRELEKVMGHALSRKRLVGFDYGEASIPDPSAAKFNARRTPSSPRMPSSTSTRPPSRRFFSTTRVNASPKSKPAETYTASGWRSFSHAV